MKHWLYCEGNILGPYAPFELMAIPAFAQDSLVCQETSSGDNPGDWRPAFQVGEIAEVLSVGAGKVLSSVYGGLGDPYTLQTGFSQACEPAYENVPEQGYSYEGLLNTIDDIMKAGSASGEGAQEREKVPDYSLMDKFDIRLSRIQEDLEAARLEKNFLLEKMSMKEQEDGRLRERITELEGRLKAVLGGDGAPQKEFEQFLPPVDTKAKSDAAKKTEDVKNECVFEAQGAEPQPAPGQEKAAEKKDGGGLKSLKSLQTSWEINSQRRGSNFSETEPDIMSSKLKSLGPSPGSLSSFTSAPADPQQPAPDFLEPAHPQSAPQKLEPLPQQAGGMVYDFTVVTPKNAEPLEKVRFQIEAQIPASVPDGVVPPGAPPGGTAAPVSFAPADAGQSGYQLFDSAGVNGQQSAQPHVQPVWPPLNIQPAQPGVSDGLGGQTAPQAHTQRAGVVYGDGSPLSSVPPSGTEKHSNLAEAPARFTGKSAPAASVPMQGKKPAETVKISSRKGGKMAFFTILIAFSAVAAGGLGFFFFGDGLSFPEVLMLDFNSSKRAKKSEAFAASGAQIAEKSSVRPAESAPGPSAAGATVPTRVAGANDGVKAAIETVKNYRLSGGRGVIGGWFANSFLSGASAGASEEWSATPLHGDVLVVQYRLIRQKQDPLVYQFEVDGVKNDIIRGINNNAIDLLDFSSAGSVRSVVPPQKAESAVKKMPVRKLSARARPVKKSVRSGGIPVLPLPDEPPGGQKSDDPTGFEDAQPEGGEKVKYIRAQESDEELF